MSIMSLTLSLVFPLLGKIMREINSAAFDFFFLYCIYLHYHHLGQRPVYDVREHNIKTYDINHKIKDMRHRIEILDALQ